jgi:serine/threonine protein kinase
MAAFLPNETPSSIHTPWCFQAPELVFATSTSQYDRRIDIWALGSFVGPIRPQEDYGY